MSDSILHMPIGHLYIISKRRALMLSSYILCNISIIFLFLTDFLSALNINLRQTVSAEESLFETKKKKKKKKKKTVKASSRRKSWLDARRSKYSLNQLEMLSCHFYRLLAQLQDTYIFLSYSVEEYAPHSAFYLLQIMVLFHLLMSSKNSMDGALACRLSGPRFDSRWRKSCQP